MDSVEIALSETIAGAGNASIARRNAKGDSGGLVDLVVENLWRLIGGCHLCGQTCGATPYERVTSGALRGQYFACSVRSPLPARPCGDLPASDTFASPRAVLPPPSPPASPNASASATRDVGQGSGASPSSTCRMSPSTPVRTPSAFSDAVDDFGILPEFGIASSPAASASASAIAGASHAARDAGADAGNVAGSAASSSVVAGVATSNDSPEDVDEDPRPLPRASPQLESPTSKGSMMQASLDAFQSSTSARAAAEGEGPSGHIYCGPRFRKGSGPLRDLVPHEPLEAPVGARAGGVRFAPGTREEDGGTSRAGSSPPDPTSPSRRPIQWHLLPT
eukprot:TRINITY_DN20696_c0_g1_i2.p1 TRINITY_DN20696_c0_g1~~TRINITY_DN20696_c0_g1_i2.p1  ORF type:complete len:336 (-),score=52.00 TRINITY_DN20696_c0_g1_i2:32-1039(-)